MSGLAPASATASVPKPLALDFESIELVDSEAPSAEFAVRETAAQETVVQKTAVPENSGAAMGAKSARPGDGALARAKAAPKSGAPKTVGRTAPTSTTPIVATEESSADESLAAHESFAANADSESSAPGTAASSTGALAGSSTGGSGLGLGLGLGGSGRAGSSASKPRLLPGGAGCSDLFPYAAKVDSRVVTVELAVAESGRARMLREVGAHKDGDAFRAAASACSSRLRFAPAHDALGHAVKARAVVRLRFERS